MGHHDNPVLLFMHGWPDTGALWANQFEHFCAPPHGKYFCVAPTMSNFHPDVPPAPEKDLFFDVQLGKYHEIVQEMHLTDITLVAFDWGAILGYNFAYKYPRLVKALVTMDLAPQRFDGSTSGDGLLPKQRAKVRSEGEAGLEQFPSYFQANVKAYQNGDFSKVQLPEAFRKTIWQGHPHPKFWQLQTLWPYQAFINNQSGQELFERLNPEVPLAKWKFNNVPNWPNNMPPLLFMYGACKDGTGCEGCSKKCAARGLGLNYFFWEADLEWICSRWGTRKGGKGGMRKGEVIQVPGAGHWMMTFAASATNEAIDNFLGGVKNTNSVC
jgi:pimeloyl-ACP methyl ester carboxylesterase